MENHKAKILVVDDEQAVRRILQTRLTMAGYDVVTAANGEEALLRFEEENPDLIILDIMMPKIDGYSLCQELRKTSTVPIIMLTALADVADRIAGLQMGADDYLVKPFSPKELEARIHRILGRYKKTFFKESSGPGTIKVGYLSVDSNRRKVYINSELIRLTEIEFNILHLLISQAGQPYSRAEILEAIWGYAPQQTSDLRLVDVHISRLRSKIEADPKQPEFIITERGMGYSFQRFANMAQPPASVSVVD